MTGFSTSSDRSYRISVVRWCDFDGIASEICRELANLGHDCSTFRFDEAVPTSARIIFSFAPYGRFLQLPHRLSMIPPKERPLLLHWNFESLPNIKIPWGMLKPIASVRSWIDRLNDSDSGWTKSLVQRGLFSPINCRMHKFRYLGDYHYAHCKGLLDLLFDSSEIFAEIHSAHGIPTQYVPWGTSPSWYAELDLDRDIDVLWMGQWRTKRRAKWLRRIRRRLTEKGLRMYVADNVENPFLFGEKRTRFLNRSILTLNLLPTWYDPGFPFRYHLAAANRSLVISNSLIRHAPVYEEGKHYVSACEDSLVDAICYYLGHEEERLQIVENAYELVTQKLTLANSIRIIMQSVENHIGRKELAHG